MIKFRAGSVQYTSVLWFSVLLLILLMPFHAFLTTWVGTSLGYRPLWQSWKEIVILFSLLITIIACLEDRKLFEYLVSYRVNQLIFVYVSLHFLMALLAKNDGYTEALALKTNLAFFGVFITAQAASFRSKKRFLEAKISKIILATTSIVVFFGLLQVFLPAEFLTHFGYSAQTINSYVGLQDTSLKRAFSFLGGPNQLGSFLILPITLAVSRVWGSSKKFLYILLLASSILALILSSSRSAWVGLAVSIFMFFFISANRKIRKTILISSILAVTLSLGVLIYIIPRSAFLQSYVLHANARKAFSASSNVDHLKATAKGVHEVVSHPQGLGPGRAGPASLLQPDKKLRLIPENYYLQIALEVGIIGLGLFVWIVYLTGRELYNSTSEEMGLVLFCSLVGLSIFNLMQHGWADSSTSIIWWATAGLYIHRGRIPSMVKSRHE